MGGDLRSEIAPLPGWVSESLDWHTHHITIVPTLETARLVLRSYGPPDIPELVRLIGAREVAATTLRVPHPYTEQDAEEFIGNIDEEHEARFAITLRASGGLCGGVGLRIDREHRHAELGYWIGVPYWGNGYATEAARAVLGYGFEDLKLHRIFATHFKQNAASRNVLQKLGMRHEGCLRSHVLKWGNFIDVEIYAVLSQE